MPAPVTTPARPHRLADARTRLRRAVLRRRRALAAVAAAIAVGASLLTLRPPEPPTRLLMVAARDLPAGSRLATSDLHPAEVPEDLVPAGALEAAAGEVLAAPVRRGEPVTDARVVGPALLPEGAVESAVPVRLSDAAQAALLAPGDRIDLLATDPSNGVATRVAEDITVLAVPPLSEGGAGAASAGGALGGRLVVLALPRGVSEQVTGAAVTSFVTFLWSPR